MALYAIMAMVRHTRAEEESGRAEVIGSLPLGRFAPLVAATLASLVTAGATGIVCALLLVVAGLPTAGSIAWGLAIVAAGWVMTGVAAVAAQLADTGRGATGIAAGVFAVAYIIRFVADGTGAESMRWLSIFGWSHLVAPYAANRWWVLLVPFVATVLLVGVAFALRVRRDLGAGWIHRRPGRPRAAGWLRSGPALAWRLQRRSLVVWTVSVAVITAAVTVVAGGMGSLESAGTDQGAGAAAEFLRRYTAGPGASLTDAYLWLIMLSVGGVVALYPMLTVLRLRTEDATGRSETVLSTRVTPLSWASGTTWIALGGGAVIMLAAGFGAGLAHAIVLGDPAQFGRLVIGAAVLIPPAWIFGGLALLAYALMPRAAAAVCWGAWLFVNLFGEQLGPILGLRYELAGRVVPYSYVPKVLSGGQFEMLPLLGLTVVAAALVLAGLGAYGRRDLA